MKKIIKISLLISVFAMPNMAFSSCPCYDIFNAGWQAANSSFATCAMNAGMSNLGAYGSRGISGTATSFGSIGAFLRCQGTFYASWDSLGAQFNYCTATNCRIE